MFKVVGPHSERLATNLAHVRLLSSVQGRVYLQIPGCLEGFVADWTGESAFTVHILSVAIHRARATESFTTIDARVRKLASVFAHVNFQSILVDERGVTVLALVRFRSRMRFDVLIEGTLVAHLLLTDGAVVSGGFAFVNLAMAFETVIGSESGTTLFTFEFLFAAVQFHMILQRDHRFHLFTAQMTDEITFTGVDRI